MCDVPRHIPNTNHFVNINTPNSDLFLLLYRKDYLSQRGLRKIIGKRQRLLSYLAKKNGVRYKELISQLNIQESKTR
ncbi:hypothetical protein Peur_067342 [Populus x canadensis]